MRTGSFQLLRLLNYHFMEVWQSYTRWLERTSICVLADSDWSILTIPRFWAFLYVQNRHDIREYRCI